MTFTDISIQHQKENASSFQHQDTPRMPSPWCVSRCPRGTQAKMEILESSQFEAILGIGPPTVSWRKVTEPTFDLGSDVGPKNLWVFFREVFFWKKNPGSEMVGEKSNVENGWKTLGVQLLQQWFVWYQLYILYIYQLYQPYIRVVKGGAVFNQICLMAQKISAPTWPPHQTKRSKCPNPKISELQTYSFLLKAQK